VLDRSEPKKFSAAEGSTKTSRLLRGALRALAWTRHEKPCHLKAALVQAQVILPWRPPVQPIGRFATPACDRRDAIGRAACGALGRGLQNSGNLLLGVNDDEKQKAVPARSRRLANHSWAKKLAAASDIQRQHTKRGRDRGR